MIIANAVRTFRPASVRPIRLCYNALGSKETQRFIVVHAHCSVSTAITHRSLSTTLNASVTPKSQNTPSNNAELAKEQIINMIQTERIKHKPLHLPVLTGLQLARKEKVSLEASDLLFGIFMAAFEKGPVSDIAFWAYDTLKERGTVLPVESYVRLLQVCLNRDSPVRAQQIAEDLCRQGHSLTEQMLILLVSVISRRGQSEYAIALADYYQQYKNLVVGSPPGTSHYPLFMQVATFHCRTGASAAALSALQDLTAAGHEPTADMCAPLLDAALFILDAPVLRVLTSWYAGHFPHPMERGVLNRVLDVAAVCGDTELAQLAFQSIARADYTQTSSHFAGLIRASLANGDVVSAVEALQEMQLRGLTFTHSVFSSRHRDCANFTIRPHDGQIESLRGLMSRALSRSGGATHLDKLYYVLADQVRSQGQAVPRLALDALVETAGRLDLNDRAFAVMQEYSSLFRVAPDVHSYNALLASVGCARVVNMHTMFSVFEQIEAAANTSSTGIIAAVECRPNELSFSLLLEAMVCADDFRGLPEVLAYMRDCKVRARPRAMRRVIASLARQGDWMRVDEVRAALVSQEGRDLPVHLKQRLSALREAEKRKRTAAAPATESALPLASRNDEARSDATGSTDSAVDTNSSST